uniref:Uncharacterized protein n=1 Tax=Rhizophora mucronata TaxID=61149 RepID=A0A2P2IHZ9_RHIMU
MYASIDLKSNPWRKAGWQRHRTKLLAIGHQMRLYDTSPSHPKESNENIRSLHVIRVVKERVSSFCLEWQVRDAANLSPRLLTMVAVSIHQSDDFFEFIGFGTIPEPLNDLTSDVSIQTRYRWIYKLTGAGLYTTTACMCYRSPRQRKPLQELKATGLQR